MLIAVWSLTHCRTATEGNYRRDCDGDVESTQDESGPTCVRGSAAGVRYKRCWYVHIADNYLHNNTRVCIFSYAAFHCQYFGRFAAVGPRRQEMLIDYWFVHVTELCCDNYLHNNTRVCIFSSVWNLLPTTDCHLLYHLEGGAKNYTSVT